MGEYPAQDSGLARSAFDRFARMVTQPVAVSLPVAAHLLRRNVQLAGYALEAVAVTLVGYDDCTTEPDTCPRSEGKRVLLCLLVCLSGFEDCGHVGCHSFRMP